MSVSRACAFFSCVQRSSAVFPEDFSEPSEDHVEHLGWSLLEHKKAIDRCARACLPSFCEGSGIVIALKDLRNKDISPDQKEALINLKIRIEAAANRGFYLKEDPEEEIQEVFRGAPFSQIFDVTKEDLSDPSPDFAKAQGIVLSLGDSFDITHLALRHSERLKLALDLFEFSFSKLVKHIEQFRLIEEARFMLVKELLHKRAAGLPRHIIEKFDLNQERRFVCAKELCKVFSLSFAYYILDFNLTEDQFTECTELLLQKAPRIVVERLRHFDLKEPQLEALAERLFKQNPDVFACWIGDFNFMEEKSFDWAKRFVARAPLELIWFIEKFGISSDDKRFKLAEMIIKKEAKEEASFDNDLSVVKQLMWKINYFVLEERVVEVVEILIREFKLGKERSEPFIDRLATRVPKEYARCLQGFQVSGS